MSSENLDPRDAALFRWHAGLSTHDYVLAHYRIETASPPDLAALGMAREQSACASRLPTGPVDLEHVSARVVDVRVTGPAPDDPVLPPYRLNTPIYAPEVHAPVTAEVTIAFPVANVGRNVARLLNHVFGELPRLGFLRAVRLLRLDLPDALLAGYAGPALGVAGVRAALAIDKRPLLCRSTRPAVGLDTAAMIAINREVLAGGFDLIKDDELTPDDARSPTRERWPALAALARSMGADGERKGFIVNLCDRDDDPADAARAARDAGAFGALLAPGWQGYGGLRDLGAANGLASLAHNTGSDTLTRSPRMGVAPAVWIQCCRLAGADLVMMPGESATNGMTSMQTRECVAAALAPLGALRAAMPVLAGGKQAQRLKEYCELVESTDFMLIVAAAVDEHPDGPRAGARAFRQAWDTMTV
jgi:ribulose-bisphosphate carboxylase large chain